MTGKMPVRLHYQKHRFELQSVDAAIFQATDRLQRGIAIETEVGGLAQGLGKGWLSFRVGHSVRPSYLYSGIDQAGNYLTVNVLYRVGANDEVVSDSPAIDQKKPIVRIEKR